MPNKLSKVDIMNLMGGAAHKKAQLQGKTASPDDENDPVNSINPKVSKSPSRVPSGDKDDPAFEYSPEAQNDISNSMHDMKNENKPQKQKVAIALSKTRQKGMKVPAPKNS